MANKITFIIQYLRLANTPRMRQLKGKVKETAKEKKERKKEFMENKEKAFTVALPVFVGLFIVIALLVYFKTRPKEIEL